MEEEMRRRSLPPLTDAFRLRCSAVFSVSVGVFHSPSGLSITYACSKLTSPFILSVVEVDVRISHNVEPLVGDDVRWATAIADNTL